MDGWTGHREKKKLIQLTLDDVDMLWARPRTDNPCWRYEIRNWARKSKELTRNTEYGDKTEQVKANKTSLTWFLWRWVWASTSSPQETHFLMLLRKKRIQTKLLCGFHFQVQFHHHTRVPSTIQCQVQFVLFCYKKICHQEQVKAENNIENNVKRATLTATCYVFWTLMSSLKITPRGTKQK